MLRHNVFRIFIGMMTVFVIIMTTAVVFAQADQPLWPVQLDTWCTDHGYVGIEVDGSQNNVFGLGCKDSSGVRHGIDLAAICTDLYGADFANPQYSNYEDAFSWKCYRVSVSPPPANPPQPHDQPNGGSNGGNTPSNSETTQQQQSQPSGNTSDARYPDAQENTGPGVFVPVICKDWGHGWSSSEPNNAYGWRCDDGFSFGPDEFSQACRDAWGSDRPYATLANWQDKYGWRCVNTPGYVDPMPGENSGGSNGQQSQSSGCSNAPAEMFAPGMTIEVITDEVNLRSDPSRSGTIRAKMYTGAHAQVIGNSTCADGYRWWQMTYQGTTGWAVDGDTTEGSYWEQVDSSSLQPDFSGEISVDEGSASLNLSIATTVELNICNPDCNIDHGNWIAFNLPANRYVDGTLRLHSYSLSGKVLTIRSIPLSAEDRSNGLIYVRMGVSHTVLGVMMSSGLANINDLRNPANWWLTYQPK